MSSNIPKPLSGIPKPSSSSVTGAHKTTGSRVQESAHSTNPPQPKGVDPHKINEPPVTKQSVAMDAPSNWRDLEIKYKQDIEALTESTEMATIEKEIAEEKLDICEREIQELKDKLADATLQIDLLKGDQQVGAGLNESAVTVFQLQKVEEQNELLKQAWRKLCDISTNDKKALEDLQIEHEELQEKFLDLEMKEQKYLEQIKIYEEQIDVTQNAQEMVEKLTQQKTDLEDKLRDMVEDFDCMEKLRDLNEQLLESARENEIELTEELDKMRVQFSELNKRKRDMEDYLLDQERSVSKLKEENRLLNDQIVHLKSQFKEGESIEQQKHQIENVAYKLNFSETKMLEKEAEIARYKRNLVEIEDQMNNLSMITKEQSARLDELKLQLDAKTSQNSDLQRALKKKMEEVSELEIRREMAEKKLQAVQRDAESKVASFNRTIETMKGIEVQHEEDIKRLMEDNEIIERERRELRDQLNKSNRSLERSMQTGNVSMITAQDTSLASLGISFQTTCSNQPSPLHHNQGSNPQLIQSSNMVQLQSSPTTASMSSATEAVRQISMSSDIDKSIFMTKMKDMSKAFEKVNKKNYNLEIELALRELENRVPPYTGSSLASYYDIDRAKTLRTEVNKLKKEVRAAMINQQICPKSRHVFSQIRSDKFNNSKLVLKYQALENEANALVSNSSLARLRPREPLLQSTPVK